MHFDFDFGDLNHPDPGHSYSDFDFDQDVTES